MLNSSFWMLDAGFWMQESRFEKNVLTFAFENKTLRQIL
jgi:hypothetical protein